MTSILTRQPSLNAPQQSPWYTTNDHKYRQRRTGLKTTMSVFFPSYILLLTRVLLHEQCQTWLVGKFFFISFFLFYYLQTYSYHFDHHCGHHDHHHQRCQSCRYHHNGCTSTTNDDTHRRGGAKSTRESPDNATASSGPVGKFFLSSFFRTGQWHRHQGTHGQTMFENDLIATRRRLVWCGRLAGMRLLDRQYAQHGFLFNWIVLLDVSRHPRCDWQLPILHVIVTYYLADSRLFFQYSPSFPCISFSQLGFGTFLQLLHLDIWLLTNDVHLFL